MKHVDLFSGAGMFSLAAEWVWEEEYENVAFCDIDPYCQQLLKLRFPKSKIYGDIRDVKNIGSVDLITGGFPCQPFSNAGKKGGKNDDRFLWPEMLRIIKECKPTWVIGENVAGLSGMVQYTSDFEVESNGDYIGEIGSTLTREGYGILKEILESLEAEGYEVQPIIIPACAVNAPHRRDRVWIIAYSNKVGSLEGQSEINTAKRKQTQSRSTKCFGDAANSNTGRIQRYKRKGAEKKAASRGSNECDATNTSGIRNESLYNNGDSEANNGEPSCEWDRPWLEVATELCRVDDGLPAELDGFELSKSKHREERLKALGNAIVPQVVYQIMKSIKEL